jgi:4-carboxymuconolactone decarboxylase
VNRVDEDWAKIISDFVINGMYSRGVLPTAVRELCAVAALTAIGRMDELKAHIRIALRSNPPEHVREAILQMSVYGGVPAAQSGMRLFEQVIAENG